MTAPEPRAIYFGPAGRESFGWLHIPPPQHASRLGLVICSPFGNDDQFAHRGLRQLAMTAARLGLPSLRFDYHGCGDAAGSGEANDRPSMWVKSVHDAIDLVRTQCGVDTVCVFGMRLGATLGALAAAERDDVAAFAALAPITAGASYLRELTLRGEATEGVDQPFLESGGFTITAEAREELSQLDLSLLAKPPAPRVLIVRRDDIPGNHRWANQLRSSGAAVESDDVPGYAEWIASGRARPELIAHIAHWAAAQAPLEHPATRHLPLPVVTQARPMLELPATRPSHRDVQERPIKLGGPAALSAVLSAPADGVVSQFVVVLNVGIARRIGPSRMYVEWARHWAARGVAVLRLDLPGLGDSNALPDEAEGEPYGCGATPAIAAAVAFMQARFGSVPCHLTGICSGAFHALKAALAGVPVQGLMLVNPATFYWDHDTQRDKDPLAWRIASALVERDREQRLGEVPTRPISRLKVFAAIACTFALNTLRDATRAIGLRLPHDLGGELRDLAQRKIALHFIFSEFDRGWALLRLHGGRSVATLQARGELDFHKLDRADHVFTTRASRARLLRVLDGPLMADATHARRVCDPARARAANAARSQARSATP